MLLLKQILMTMGMVIQRRMTMMLNISMGKEGKLFLVRVQVEVVALAAAQVKMRYLIRFKR